MKVNVVKFFCSTKSTKPNPIPEPKPNIRKRFELVKKGCKLDKFM